MDTRPLDPEASTRFTEALARVEGLERRLQIVARAEAESDSRATADGASPHARYILMFSGMAMAVAVDHLVAWRRIATSGPIPIYAPMALLRGAFEAAVLVRWLVDRRVAASERVGRGIAAQLVDYEERGKFEADAKSPEERPSGMGKSARARHADLVAARRNDGIPIVPMLGPTALAGGYGVPGFRDQRWLFRIMSAFAHAKPWALNATTMGPVTAHGTPGLMRGAVTTSDIVIVGATTIVVDHVETALLELETYVGLAGPT